MLKLRLGGDDILFPAVGIAQVPPQLLIEPLSRPLLQHPLAVGRVADENAALGGQVHLGSVPIPEGNTVGNAGLSGVGHGQGNALGIVVRAQNLVLPLEFLVLCLGAHLPPKAGLHPGEGLGGKPAVHARRPVFGDQRRLDGDGAGAAEGIPDKIPTPVTGQLHHGGGQGLPQGSVVALGTVAPLVKPRAGGVQVQLHPVVHDGKLELVFRAGFRQPGHAVLFAQPPGGGLLHNGLAVRHAHELTAQAVTLHRERPVLGDVVFQLRAVNPLKQLFKGGCLEIRQHQQHPLAGAQAHVGLGQRPLVSGKQHPAVLHPDVFHIQSAQLVAGNALQAEQRRHGKFKIRHSFSFKE